jgi:hypothetical protein
MAKATKNTMITVKGTDITLFRANTEDYISLTDIAKYRDSRTEVVIQNWMRTRMAIELLGLWETLYNPNFKHIEFDVFKGQAGLNGFVLSPKQWIEKTNAIGLVSKSGRYGGTYAHRDIAFEFASWISVEFKLFMIQEFDRLKNEEQQRLSLEWNLQRTISKINYRIHTDAIKTHIVPPVVTKAQAGAIYASEADLLNVALFGKTAAEWRDENSDAKGNIRDEATLEQLIVLSNMESINALLISHGLPQSERLVQLNRTAIAQMTSLIGDRRIERLYDGEHQD